MTQADLTELIFIIDRSGSMEPIKKDMEGGFHQFLADQRKLPGKCLVTIAQFSDTYEITHNAVDVQSSIAFELKPQGYTALLGAIGRTIDEVGARLASTPEDQRPSKVLVVTITDGEENHSSKQEWSRPYSSRAEVMSRVKHQTEAYGWEFVYLGANQDSIAVGADLGITTVANFSATPKGAQDMLRGVSMSVANYRSGGGYAS